MKVVICTRDSTKVLKASLSLIRHKREMEAYNAGVSFKKTPIKDNPQEDAENEETKEVFSSTNETLQIASHFKVRFTTLLPFKPDALLSLIKSSF